MKRRLLPAKRTRLILTTNACPPPKRLLMAGLSRALTSNLSPHLSSWRITASPTLDASIRHLRDGCVFDVVVIDDPDVASAIVLYLSNEHPRDRHPHLIYLAPTPAMKTSRSGHLMRRSPVRVLTLPPVPEVLP